tara:strand:- start:313 stop:495 length:183 start_codon:yes stop_codon:yes gene_type:complete
MKKLWHKIKTYFSGKPEDKYVDKEINIEKPDTGKAKIPKKPKGLNSKKKKKKGKKQGNLT